MLLWPFRTALSAVERTTHSRPRPLEPLEPRLMMSASPVSVDDGYAAETQTQEAALLLPAVQMAREAARGKSSVVPVETITLNYERIRW